MTIPDRALYAIAPPAPTSLAVVGSEKRFPVGRIFCVGRNYADHAREMGHVGTPEPPFFFMKPADAVVEMGKPIIYPSESTDVHHEVEMVVAIGVEGGSINPSKALDHVFGYGIGLDLTRRDLQAAAKKYGRPWEVAKSFPGSAPMGPIMPATHCGDLFAGSIWLDVNGLRRQAGDLKDMIWSVPDILSHISRFFVLRAGDVVMTGTPAGVGPIKRGMKITAGIAKLGQIAFSVE